MGSVKDLEIIREASVERLGIGRFHFSDRYSIFDWGEMPDHIRNKGKALAVMAAYNFERLEEIGIPTHYRGLVRDGEIIRVDQLERWSGGADIMEVDLAIKHMPKEIHGEDGTTKYDYTFFDDNRGNLNNYLIPLEIIFRNGLPEGSSIFDKIRHAQSMVSTSTSERVLMGIMSSLGLDHVPEPGEMLPSPIVRYTTKLEPGDRELNEGEAEYISGLSVEQFKEVPALALKINDYITKRANETGLSPHWDGKVEMIYSDGLKAVDVLGTLDENRFGDRINKEFLRQWYDANQPEFHAACKEWKARGDGWQNECPIKPIELPETLSLLVSQMYMAAANKWIGKEVFNTFELDLIMDRLKAYRD
ncbi:hypothetical protein H6503_04390 [Candidatus Woesearchaeota archaeon]|nr:hypothetical protein [Candidatus Woesearchaeota archaeon]